MRRKHSQTERELRDEVARLIEELIKAAKDSGEVCNNVD